MDMMPGAIRVGSDLDIDNSTVDWTRSSHSVIRASTVLVNPREQQQNADIDERLLRLEANETVQSKKQRLYIISLCGLVSAWLALVLGCIIGIFVTLSLRENRSQEGNGELTYISSSPSPSPTSNLTTWPSSSLSLAPVLVSSEVPSLYTLSATENDKKKCFTCF